MIAAKVEGASLLRSILASGVVAALVAAVVSLVTLATSGRRARQDRQRQLFADAFEACIAYREFAYVVRRRRDNSSDEVAWISGAMSEVQTRLRSFEARLRVEAPRVGVAYSRLVAETRTVAGAQVRLGWESPPLPPDGTGRIKDVDFSPLAASEGEFLDAARNHLALLPAGIRSWAQRTWRWVRGKRGDAGSPNEAQARRRIRFTLARQMRRRGQLVRALAAVREEDTPLTIDRMTRRFHSLVTRLVSQSQDAALTAVQVFNNLQVRFKSETFIVLMNIAWTYLMHAHYRRAGVEYRYFSRHGNRRRFERTADGSFRYWDLSRCLASAKCPLDNETKKNLLFLIGLRDEITHHMSPVLDQFVSARYQACCMNYNRYVKKLFGDRFGLDQYLGYSLQFQGISRQQLGTPTEADLPPNVRTYIAQFDNGLTADELNSDRFAFRMLFVPKLVGKPGQADQVIEFLKPDSEITKAVNKDYVSFKEVERPKFLPGQIVRMMHEEGYGRFSVYWHTVLWQKLDAKRAGKGWGVDVAGAWYWYSSWVDVVRQHCADNADDYR